MAEKMVKREMKVGNHGYVDDLVLELWHDPEGVGGAYTRSRWYYHNYKLVFKWKEISKFTGERVIAGIHTECVTEREARVFKKSGLFANCDINAL